MQFIKSGKGSNKSDEELIFSYRTNPDTLIIGILFNRYSHLVFAVCMKFLKNEEDSKDAVIQIFEKIPRDLNVYNIHNFSSWLHTVTKNYCFRFLSKKKNYPLITENIPDNIDDEEKSFEEFYLPFLDDAINMLNKEQQLCIDLFYIKKMSYQEISEKTKFSMNEVKSYIQNGKRNLKIILLKKSNDNI